MLVRRFLFGILIVQIIVPVFLEAQVTKQVFSDLPDLNTAWHYQIYENDPVKARALAKQVLVKDPSNYKAHELLYVIAEMHGDDQATFNHALEMFRHNRIENSVYLIDFIYRGQFPWPVWLSLEQLRELEKTLKQTLIDETGLLPELRLEIKQVLFQVAMETERWQEARQYIVDMGFIRKWMVIGGFNNIEKMGFDEVYPPEKEINLNKQYEGRFFDVSWRAITSERVDGVVNLDNVLQPNEWAVGYALTYIFSPSDRYVRIHVGSDDAMKLWLNDEPLIEDPTYKGFKPGQHVLDVNLNKGWNKVLIKVCEGGQFWEFAFQVTDSQGDALRDLKISQKKQSYKKGLTNAKQGGVENYYANLIEQDLGNTKLNHYLAKWYFKKNCLKFAVKQYEYLTTLYDQSAWYAFEASQALLVYGNRTKAVRFLKQAVGFYPEYTNAFLHMGYYYQKSNLLKKAQQKYEEAHKLNPRLVEPLLGLASVHYKRNRLEKAYQYSQQAVEVKPEFTRAYNDLGYYSEQKGHVEAALLYYEKALERQPLDGVCINNIINYYFKHGQYEKALRYYDKFLAFNPRRVQSYLGMANCYLRQQKYSEAEKLCKQALIYSPDHPDLYIKLGMIALEQKQPEKARVLWKKALHFKPDNMWLRNYIRNVLPDKNVLFEQASLSPEKRKQLLEKKIDPKDYPKAEAVVLFDQQIVQLFKDGSNSFMVHYMIKILNSAGRENFGVLPIEQNENLKIKRAVTINPDGEEIETTDIQNGRVSFAGLQDGSVIELKYVYDEFRGGWQKGHFYSKFYFQWEYAPLLKSEFVVSLPKSKELKTYFPNKKGVKETVENRGSNRIYTWRAENMDQIYNESHRPPLNDLASMIYVSTLPSWDFLSKWSNSLIKDQMDVDPMIQKKIGELIADKKNKVDQIKTIYDFVAQDIRYYRREGDPIFGVKPQKVANTFADGYGVCKDKALLLIAMLKEIDVPAYFSLLQIRRYGRQVKAIPFPHFNHAIVYIDGPGEEKRFVDPTGYYFNYGELWGEVQDVDTFVCKSDGYTFIKTPILPATVDQVKDTMNATIDNKGNLTATVQEVQTGAYAASSRMRYTVEGKQKEYLEEAINEVQSGAELLSYSIKGLKDLTVPMEFCYTYRAPTFAREFGGYLYFKSVDNYELTRQFAQKHKRNYDLRFSSKWRNETVQTYTLPSDYSLAQVPLDIDVDTKWLHYKRKIENTSTTISIHRIIEFKVLEVKQSDYESFRKLCINIDAEEKKEMMLKRK